MVKYSLELKLEIINRYFNNEGGYLQLARKYDISTSIIRGWVKKYQYHGIDGLTKKRRTFNGYFKVNVLNYIEEHGLSPREATAKFNLGSHETVKQWQLIRKTQGDLAFFKEKRGRNSMASNKDISNEPLEDEVQRLRLENAYLKKLISLSRKTDLKKKKLKQEPFSNSRNNSK